jgi:hypothetical protein
VSATTAQRWYARTALALAVSAVLCTVTAPAPAVAKAAKSPRLKAFGSCSGLVTYARRNALRTRGAGDVAVRAIPGPPLVLAAPQPALGQPQAAPAPAAGREADSFSTTNVQEAGIDEPDIVKTDGKRILAIADGKLHLVDVSGGAPRLAGSLALEGYDHQLLIRGNRALVMASAGHGPVARPAATLAPDGRVTTILTEVDLTDPATMRVARTLTLDGAFVSARLTGATARVVVSSSPRPVAEPAAIRRAGVRTWVPRTVLRSRVSGRTFRRAVVGCRAVRRPPEFSGLDLLTVLTIDLDRGLYSVDRDAVMAGAQTVYASDRSLYVASRRWAESLEEGRRVPEGTRTTIHRFDASQPGATSYRSSGEVPGFVLNQFSLSEHRGDLRVATTSEPPWFAERPAAESESFVSVLRERDSTLAEIGRVGGLGRGERIYAVRFLGDTGYVVTFRQVDPLYTIDLSTPSAPKVAGELKILGYSAYLHPVGGDLLLGVGQDATAEGRRLGLQLSLFDVSDLRKPARLHQRALGADATSDAEFDHHAFLWWPATKLAVLPVQTFARDTAAPGFTGAIGFRVGRAEGIGEVGRVAHPGADFPVPIGRSLVVGDLLYTLSYAGLAASRLDTVAPTAFVPFK